jgi:DNA-binding transcriptional MerR regulator
MSLLGVREVAARLGIHENTVRNWQRRGWITAASILPSGYHRYDCAEVERVRRLMRDPADHH